MSCWYRSVGLITLVWPELSYRVVSHQRRPRSDFEHVSTYSKWYESLGGGCWAISKKCSIIEENCEGCQRVPGMSLSAGWLQLNERCLSREILCLINEMNQQLWTHLPTISAAEIFFFPRLWTSSCGYVHICAEWYEFNGEWEWARHCWCRKEIVMSGFGQCRESRVSVSDSS